MKRPLLVASVALALAGLGAGLALAHARSGARPAVRVAPGLAKLRPADLPPAAGPPRIELRALRGECELAHLAIHAGRERIDAVRARIEGDPGAGATLRLYREALVELGRRSGPDGAAGAWPDPLVPAVDAWAGERRRAFPFAVPPGETRAILVEACVAGDAAPGVRRARVLLDAGPASTAVPVSIAVERAAIPATATFPTSFGFSALRTAIGHHGRPGTDAEVRHLDRVYRTALLAHRVSAHGGTMAPPPFRRGPDGLELSFDAYDREVGPFLDGTALPSGARATTVELRTHPALADDAERIAYWKAIAAHHRARGWDAILFDYAKDEPARAELPEVAARAKLVRRADPGIRVLLTASFDPSLASLVDLWAPNLNCLFTRSRPDEFCSWRAPRSAYRSPWWYVSCSSHGCGDGEKGAYFDGWAGYAIDLPGARARAMGWLAFRERIGGELYWDTVYAHSPQGRPVDPWSGESLRAFGVNGDGTLLYPGTPARIGGRTHVPVESLRLKLIRDGLEDLELLRLVAARPGGDALARQEAARLAPEPWKIESDPAVWAEARTRLLDFLAEAKPAR